MSRLMLASTIGSLLLTLSCAPAETVPPGDAYLGYSIGTEHAPPPPTVVFVEPPSPTMVPGTSVYRIQTNGYDVYQYGSSLYLTSGGFWYRSNGFEQPFQVSDVRNVPRSVLTVSTGGGR